MSRPIPSQTTHVMRRLGAAFDPERVCEYTGLPLHLFPFGDSMGYWRTDGNLLAARNQTPQEKAWIASNPLQYQTERQQFDAWLQTVRKP